MAKSNCPAEDSAPPQASAGQLTPRFLPLSLSGRLLQVTVAISPSAAKGASKGPVFWVHPIGRSPQANAGFRNRARGELQRQNKKFYQSEGTADFREKGAFCRESSLLATFLNAAFVGEPSGLSKPENSEAPFRKPFSTGVWVSEVTAEGLEKT